MILYGEERSVLAITWSEFSKVSLIETDYHQYFFTFEDSNLKLKLICSEDEFIILKNKLDNKQEFCIEYGIGIWDKKVDDMQYGRVLGIYNCFYKNQNRSIRTALCPYTSISQFPNVHFYFLSLL